MNQRPDLAYFLPGLPANGGGVVQNTLRLIQHQCEEGKKIDVVIAGSRGRPLAPLHPSARLFDLGAGRVITSVIPLARYLRRANPPVLISARSIANCTAVWAKRISRSSTKIILSERTSLSTEIAKDGSWQFQILPFLIGLSHSHADSIVAVSSGVADDISKYTKFPRNEIHTIYNPIINGQTLLKSKEALNHPWFKTGQPPVIIGAGRLSKQKDFSTLIRAFAVLRKRREARIMIIGEGSDRSQLEGLVQELGIKADVSMPGFVDNPYPYMKAASLFVLSSAWEGFGNVLVEAMACGTSVVSTDCPSGPSEILENGKWGLLVPVGNSEAMADAMERALTHCGPNVTERANYFTVGRASDAYLELIDQLVG